MPVLDGPICPGCGLPNYEGLCPVCRGDEDATRSEGLPYPFDDDTPCRGCGCTTARACPGGCYWVADDLCSTCAASEELS